MEPEGRGAGAQSWDEVCALVAEALELDTDLREAFLQSAPVTPAVRAEAASLVAAAAAEGREAKLLDDGLPGLGGLVAKMAETEPVSPWIGRRLGAYVVERELGHGGMGLVLQATRADRLYERTVAIKVVQSTLAREEFTRRFRREMRILARLQHPAIVALLDAGITDQDQPFFVMEYVDGVPIHEYAEREALPVAALLDLVITLCDALAHAHAHGVIHRDIKPNNVLVSARGEVKLLDFGIARLSDAGSSGPEQTLTQFRAVTPTYASPEQIAGEAELTFRSDIYSTGVLLYVLLTGRPPFQLTGLSTAEMERVLRTTQPPLPSRAGQGRFTRAQAAAVDAVIGRAMEPDPGRRYDSMDALRADLQRLRAQERPSISPRRYYVRRWWRAHATAMKRAAVGTAALCCVGAGLLWLRHERNVALEAAAPPRRISVAVVPLRDANSGTGGLNAAAQEALTTELASGDQIRVVPASGVDQAMRDLKLSARTALDGQQRTDLGLRLGVDYLLEESAVAARQGGGGGNTVHLQTSLDRVRDREQIWTESQDTGIDELGAATQQIAVHAARLLPLKRSFTASPSLLPHQAEAVRLYAESLENLRAMEPVRAQSALSQAAALEPRSPLIHVALARAWDMLGYRQRAVDEAGQSIALTAGLPVRTKLAVQAPAEEIRHQWTDAIADYEKLREYDPDDIEYVLGLARSQQAAHLGKEALATLQAAASMPSLLGADPRVELLTSVVEDSLGKHVEALHSADEVFAASRERDAAQLMAQAQQARAWALESLGRSDEGLLAATQAEDLFSKAGDLKGRGVTLISTGNFQEDHAKYAEAKAAYAQAREIFARTGDMERLGVAENDLGIVAMDLGNVEEGLAQYTRALELFRQVDDLPRVAAEYNNIGTVQRRLGNAEGAKASFEANLKLLQQLHDNRSVAMAYNNLGSLLLDEGKLDAAEQDYKQAFTIYSGEGQTPKVVLSLDGLAHIAWMRGRLAEAHDRYQQVIQIGRKISGPSHLALSLRADAHVLHDAGDEAGARRELRESEEIRQANHEVLALAETRLSGITFDLDDGTDGALPGLLPGLLGAFTEHKDLDDEIAVELAWSRYQLRHGSLPEASRHFHAAEAMERKQHTAGGDSNLLPMHALLLAAQGKRAQAEALVDDAIASARAGGNVAQAMNLLPYRVQVDDPKRGPTVEALRKRYTQEATSAGFLRVVRQLQTL